MKKNILLRKSLVLVITVVFIMLILTPFVNSVSYTGEKSFISIKNKSLLKLEEGGQIITVDNEGDGPHPNFYKINDAINNAKYGDEIWVYSGTYNEEVKILGDDPKKLRLKGIPRELENGSDTGKPVIKPEIGTGNAVTIKENECFISGFDIRNPFASGIKSGICIEDTSEDMINMITDNNITGNPQGIYIHNSSNNFISSNNITYNERLGIQLSSSPNNNIQYNIFKSNGIIIKGDNLEDWNTHNIEDNIINGKPICYYKDENNKAIPSNVAQVILANCINCDVNNFIFSSIDTSIQLGFCHSNIISGNNITDNNYNVIYLSNSYDNSIFDNEIANNKYDAISLYNSYNNSIFNNNISNSEIDGIFLLNSYDNKIYQNTLTNNDNAGIHLWKSDVNEIFRNCIKRNYRGINAQDSYNNLLYHNTFIENKNQQGVYQSANDDGTNIWNESYGGNYWDEYIIWYWSKYGEAPKDTNYDDCWDVPFPISSIPPFPVVKNWDELPLMVAFTNEPPNTPEISGPRFGKIGQQYDYKLDTIEPNLDEIVYHIEWDDGDNDTIGPIKPPDYKATATHIWTIKGQYEIKVKAIDEFGTESDFGKITVRIRMPRNKPIVPKFDLLSWLFERFSMLGRLLSFLFN